MSNNYEKAVKIYEKGGQYAIYAAVKSGELQADSWRDCLPCEDKTPHEGNICLVCGNANKGNDIKWAIIAGTLESGFYVTGPFNSEQDADDYAEDAIKRYSSKLDICKVVELDNPGE